MKTTHIICILDRSGSMASIAPEVIGGFNNFIDEQKKIEGKAKVTLVLFDDQYEVLHDKVDLKKVGILTEDQYYTRGMTAMNDAIGKTINTLKKKKKAIVLIQTDGAENASQEYTSADIKTLINDKSKKGWDFQFLGADIDAVTSGNNIGIAKTLDFAKTKYGYRQAFTSMSVETANYRAS